MNRFFPSLLAGWLGGAALAVLLIVPAAAGEPAEKAGPGLGHPEFVMPQPVNLSDYWVGIGFRPLDEALRAQLGLPEGQGLLVDQVMREAPAARAEVRRHDVVLKADGQPLGQIQDLVDAVDAAKDGELSLEIIRGGKPLTIKVKPEKRPEMAGPPFQPLAPGHPGWEDMAKEWTKHFGMSWPREDGPQFGFRLFKPSVILPRGAPIHAPLPDNMSITIHKQGEEPAKIDVKRGDESWSVDENGLDALPPDVAVHVERMLGSVPFDIGGGSPVKIESQGGLRGAFQRPQMLGPDGEGRLEKRLEEMNRRIERLQEVIEGTRDRGPGAADKGSEKKSPEKKPPKVRQEQT
jgi:hypothetical protein